jgi:osmotically-inducible protein OsmY
MTDAGLIATESDAALRRRVHTRLGRLVSYPRAIDVRVTDGVVQLSGAVLAKEHEGLLHQVMNIPGVRRVVNALTPTVPRTLAR